MIRRRLTAAVILAVGAALIGAQSASAAPAGAWTGASATTRSASPAANSGLAADTLGTRSLAEVLLSDGDTFDRNWYDYDIVTQAVLAVLSAKPSSPVAVLTKGEVALTAFIPNDRAFQVLAYDLTKKWSWTEKSVFESLAATAGIDTIEKVLLYHVVPGATIDSATALASDGARLTTALPGASFTVDVLSTRYAVVRLIDNDRNDIDAYLNPRSLNLNAGNRQIAHGVVFVLRPLDL